MTIFSNVAQILIAISIAIVWVFRFHNVEKEFKQYNLSDLTRNLVGASKIILSTLLIAGIWNPHLVLIPALLMALLMVVAQFYHYKFKHPLLYFVPSFLLLMLSIFVAAVSANLL